MKKPFQRGDARPSHPDHARSQGRFIPDERIEVFSKTANSREECERLKAELESRGFTVTVRAPASTHVEGEFYVATLFAEKRETVLIDTWAVEKERRKLKKRGRLIDITSKAGFWIIVALALAGVLILSSPLIRACRALF